MIASQRLTALLAAALGACAIAALQLRHVRIGEVYFFGAAGVDVNTVRQAMGVRTGDAFTPEQWAAAEQRIHAAVTHIAGSPPTDIASVCCDSQGSQILYIGLPGKSSRPFAYHRAPTGHARLPAPGLRLYQSAMGQILPAIQAHQAGEDDTQGYALGQYPPLRTTELALRRYAMANDAAVRRVLQSSADSRQREAAAEVLGYAQQSPEQLSALVYAVRDPDAAVRNNATRALLVLASSSPAVAREIPAPDFVDMVSSGTWTDRNKASGLLMFLTQSRDPAVLDLLRQRSLPALVEIARWDLGHAVAAQLILGRVAGIPEERLGKMVAAGDVEKIIAAATGQRPPAARANK